MSGPVEQLLDLNEQILRTKFDLARERLIQRVVLTIALLSPLGLITLILVTFFTFGKYNMFFWNALFGSLFLAGCVFTGSVGANKLLDYGPSHPRSLALRLELLQEQRKLRSAELALDAEHYRSAYKDDVPATVTGLRKESKKYRRVHNYLQAVIIIGSLATSTLTGIALDGSPYQWLAVATSFSVGVAAGFTGYFKFRERSFYLQQTADAIEHEHSAVELGIGSYNGVPRDESLVAFVAEVERLRLEQRKREHSLDQPPERTSVAVPN